MHFAFSRMKKQFKKLNEKEYNFEDFQKIAKRQRIYVATYTMHDNVRGYYSNEIRKVYRKKYIVFNERLSEFEHLYVAYHELAHHFLHASNTSKQTYFCRLSELSESKYDAEADAIALIMLIPKKLLLDLHETSFEHINPFFQKLLVRRKAIYDLSGGVI